MVPNKHNYNNKSMIEKKIIGSLQMYFEINFEKKPLFFPVSVNYHSKRNHQQDNSNLLEQIQMDFHKQLAFNTQPHLFMIL